MPPKGFGGDRWGYRPGDSDGDHPAASCLKIGGRPFGIGLKPVGDAQVQPLLCHRSIVSNRLLLGPDRQFIRMNGMVVGGLTGLGPPRHRPGARLSIGTIGG